MLIVIFKTVTTYFELTVGINNKCGRVILYGLIRYECTLNAWVKLSFLIQILF